MAKVKVTRKHIKAGTQLSCFSCPIALALQDLGYTDIHVSTNRIAFKTDRFYTIDPPAIAIEFMEEYDDLPWADARELPAFEFDL